MVDIQALIKENKELKQLNTGLKIQVEVTLYP